jgi:hypothetical protein
MAKGTREWFRARKLAIIEHAKAIDDFDSAVSNFSKLVTLGPDSDADLQAALHGMGVISYARPFVADRAFSKRLISSQPGFRGDIHDHLIELRNKLVAHSDAEFADGRLFVGMLNLKVDSSRASLPTGAVVMIRNLHTLGDFELAKAYLTHSQAALQASRDTIYGALEEYARASVDYPEADDAFAKPANAGIVVDGPEFPLPLAGGTVEIPGVSLNPEQLLSLPPLKFGSDGYLYRGFAAHIRFGGSASVKMPDGSAPMDGKSRPRPPLSATSPSRSSPTQTASGQLGGFPRS